MFVYIFKGSIFHSMLLYRSVTTFGGTHLPWLREEWNSPGKKFAVKTSETQRWKKSQCLCAASASIHPYPHLPAQHGNHLTQAPHELEDCLGCFHGKTRPPNTSILLPSKKKSGQMKLYTPTWNLPWKFWGENPFRSFVQHRSWLEIPRLFFLSRKISSVLEVAELLNFLTTVHWSVILQCRMTSSFPKTVGISFLHSWCCRRSINFQL